VNACVADYNAIAGTIRLLDDRGVAGSPTPLGSGTLSNSQCTLNLATSSATPSGNDLTLALDISFAAAFVGVQPIAMRATSLAGPNTGFLAKGTWTVGLPAGGVQAISASPDSGSGSSSLFAFAFSDSAGVTEDLVVARVRFRAPGGQQCGITYNAMTNQVRMLDDAGNFSAPAVFGNGTLDNNSQCAINLRTSSAVRSGTNLTLSLDLLFKPGLAGPTNIDMRGNSNLGPTTGWVNKGTFTVQGPFVANLNPVGRGSYDLDGLSNGSAPGNVYVVGDCNIVDPRCRNGTGPTEWRNWFKFKLPTLPGPVTAAFLFIQVPAGGALSTECRPLPCTPATTAAYTLFDVAPSNIPALGTNSAAIWSDLGSGTSYGFANVTSAHTPGTFLSFSLPVAAINARLGSSFAVGGAITSLAGGSELQLLFGGTGGQVELHLVY